MSQAASRRRDFSQRTTFPGVHGNRFDNVLRATNKVEALPGPIFALLLLFLAALPGLARASWLMALVVWLFVLIDWALLASLARFGRSFGPAKPSTLLLALARLLVALLPLPIALPLEVVGTALVIHSFWIEPHRIGLTRQTLRTPKLRPGPPLRVLQLGDLHSEIAMTTREHQVIALARAAAPDLIVFTGDFLNLSYLRDPRAWEVARSVLRELRAPLGVFAVTGSPAVDREDVVPQLLAGLPNVHWLRDAEVMVEHAGGLIRIVGLSCTHKPFVDGPRLTALLGPNAPAAFNLLAYHTPDLAPEAAEAGVDLMLSGHTHGGQVRLPFYGAVIAASLYGKRYEMGRYREGAMTLYVARGIGLEGKGAPRVRFGAPPEMVLWEISGEPADVRT